MNPMVLIAGCACASLAPAVAAMASSQHDELQEILVTSTPLAEDLTSTAQSISVIAGDDLALRLAPTLGETVAGEAGVHSTFFGPGASRPVIRGLGGDRVQILTDGLATLDASGVSEDHAVAIDPALADQVEIVRGPATLLYGTGAAGGIVNVVTNRIHDDLPAAPEGLLEVRGDTAYQERAIAGRFDAGVGRVALHLDAVARETDDFDIPGFAQSRALRDELIAAGEEPDDARGTVANSWTETRSGGAGATWVGNEWLLGLAYSRHESAYGIPGGHGDEEAGPAIDLEQDRLDFAFDRRFTGGSRLRVGAAASAYEHAELEPSGEPGTLYEVDGRELRIALDHSLPWALTGTVGVQWQQVELAATGEEAFVPDSRTRSVGAFLFEERDFTAWSLELGARVDRQEVAGEGIDGYTASAINLSAGAILPVADSVTLVAQVAGIERHPSATELYADGPHAATGQYEIGSADFDTERGIQVEAGLRLAEDGRSAELRAFVVDYEGYLFLAATGAEEDGLPVFEYRQQGARFYGLEATATLELGARGWSLDLLADAVRGQLDQGGALPRIPPLRIGAELSYRHGALGATVSARHSFEQDRVAEGELPTDGYTLLDAEVSWRMPWAAGETLAFVRATNLLDEDARVHPSPLKDEVPLAGRSLAAGLRVTFGR
ncbi:MAG: putative TonB-dependent receptor precursor [Proteobacteria bacterium]|nr:putative TonB-dependent receptor precursor [Pseudomonadota bacterium]